MYSFIIWYSKEFLERGNKVHCFCNNINKINLSQSNFLPFVIGQRVFCYRQVELNIKKATSYMSRKVVFDDPKCGTILESKVLKEKERCQKYFFSFQAALIVKLNLPPPPSSFFFLSLNFYAYHLNRWPK